MLHTEQNLTSEARQIACWGRGLAGFHPSVLPFVFGDESMFVLWFSFSRPFQPTVEELQAWLGLALDKPAGAPVGCTCCLLSW